MGVGEDTKKLTEDILASYDLRVKEVRKLEKDTQSMLKEFQGEQKDMAEQLKKTFKQAEADRLKASGSLKNEIQAEQKNRNKAVADLLEKFAKDHEDMAEQLKKIFKQAEADRLKAEADRMEAFASLKNEIQAEQKNRNKAVADLLKELKTEREKMSASWQTLTAAMSKRRSGKPTMEAEVKVRPVKEAIEETKEVASGIGLEEKVLEFIERHPEGAKVGDIEEPLGVQRMRLGQVAKRLLNKGKVRREENIYFPL